MSKIVGVDYENGKRIAVYIESADGRQKFVEVRHGYWKPSPDGLTPARCSECDADSPMKSDVNEFGDIEIYHYESDYCPNCGTKMRKE